MAQLIDLSQEIYHKHPLHDLHPPTVIWTHHTYDEAEQIFRRALDGEDPPFIYTTKTLQFCDHGPTHADSFAHYGPGGATIDDMSLEYFYGPGKAIAVTKYDGTEDTYIEPEDLESACDEANVTIEDGDIVLIHTGHYNDAYPDTEYVTDYVGLSTEATEWLVDQGVKTFGVDAPGPENSDDVTMPCHQVCRDHEIPHIENLKNIEELVGKQYTFSGFPLNIRDGSGGPMRAVGILDE